MTALIRGALKTDPSEAQPPRNTAVHAPSGGGGGRGTRALGPAALKATSHSPLGQNTNNSVPQRASELPSPPLPHSHAPTLSPSSSVSLVYQTYVHPGASFTQAKGGLGGGGVN